MSGSVNTSLFHHRRWLLVAAACCLLPAAAVRADEASKAAVINPLFDVMHIDTLMRQSMQQGIETQRSQFERIEPFKSNKAAVDEIIQRMSALLDEKLSWEKLRPVMTKLYADNFTEEELSFSLAYYKTPAGQAMLTKLPKVMAESMTVVQRELGDLGPDVQRIVGDIMTKYSGPTASPSPEQ